MAINPLKAFLFAAGGTVAAVGTAYVSGALDPYLNRTPPAEVAALTPPATVMLDVAPEEASCNFPAFTATAPVNVLPVLEKLSQPLPFFTTPPAPLTAVLTTKSGTDVIGPAEPAVDAPTVKLDAPLSCSVPPVIEAGSGLPAAL